MLCSSLRAAPVAMKLVILLGLVLVLPGAGIRTGTTEEVAAARLAAADSANISANLSANASASAEAAHPVAVGARFALKYGPGAMKALKEMSNGDETNEVCQLLQELFRVSARDQCDETKKITCAWGKPKCWQSFCPSNNVPQDNCGYHTEDALWTTPPGYRCIVDTNMLGIITKLDVECPEREPSTLFYSLIGGAVILCCCCCSCGLFLLKGKPGSLRLW